MNETTHNTVGAPEHGGSAPTTISHRGIRSSRCVVGALYSLALFSVVILLPASCGHPAADIPQLSNTSGSPEEVCRRVLDALSLGDTLALQNLVLTRFEHDSILVPCMPIGQDTTGNKDLELAWFMLNQRSVKGIRRALADYEGEKFEFVSVKFNKPDHTYGALTLHKGTEVRAKKADGEEVVVGIFGSILEQDGRYKLVSIRD